MPLARPLTDRIRDGPWVPRALELGLIALILVDFTRVVVRLLGIDAALHWDEAIYAVRARGWVDAEAPTSGWSFIRSPLLPLISSIPVIAGAEEWQLRLSGMVAGLGLLLAAWWFGRLVAGPLAGIAAAGILYTSPTLQKESAVLLTDIPAATLLVVFVVLLWRELELRPRPGIGLVVAAAIAGLAFLMRYGSVLALAPILVVATALWWHRLIAAPRITLAACGTGAAFLAGHLAWSVVATGTPLGVLFRAQTVVAVYDGSPQMEAWQRYIGFTLAGSAGHVAILAGLLAVPVAAIGAVRSPRWHVPLRATILLVAPAVVHVLLLTRAMGHVEPRFFLFSTAQLILAGVIVAVLVARSLPPQVRFGAAVALIAAVVAYRGPAVDHALERTIKTARYYDVYRVVGDAMADGTAADCGILGGGYPILSWYSGCETNEIRPRSDGSSPARGLNASERWLVLFGPHDEINTDHPNVAAALPHVVQPPMVIRHPETGEELANAWRFADP